MGYKMKGFSGFGNSPAKQTKTKTQIQEDYKTAKLKSKTEPKLKGQVDYTDEERYSDKKAMLTARQKRHTQLETEGKGEKGFSWKKAGMAILQGKGLMGAATAGIGTGRDKSAIMTDKLAKLEGKTRRRKIKSAADDAAYYGSKKDKKKNSPENRIERVTQQKLDGEL